MAMTHDLLAPEGYTGAELVSSSGRGDIYRAKDRAGHQVAIRVLTPQHFVDAEALEAFAREARASLRLHHPHIVRSVAAGQRGDQRYLIMELVDGASLRSRVADHGPLSEREAMALLAQMAQALGYAWRHGVLHHGVEPANVLLGPARVGHREPFCAKLSNFGLSRLRDPGSGAGRAKAVAGNDHRADIHALAVTVCWSLTPDKRSDDAGPSTLGLDGATIELMQLLGGMLDRERLTTWESVIAAVRHLPGPKRVRA